MDPANDGEKDMTNVIVFPGLVYKLKELRSSMQKLNTEFPATQAFLKWRGLSEVQELDKAGVRSLIAHLKERHAHLCR